MTSRATKSGINRDTKAKLDAKYDQVLANECLEYIKYMINKDSEEVTDDFSTDGSTDNFYDVLRNGHRLARFMNSFQTGKQIPESKITKAKMAFFQMELIEQFINFCKQFGVPDPEVFATIDLYEKENLSQVICCLQSLGRKAKNKGFEGFGPKEADQNKRQFSEEQLKEGQKHISLQYGSNKGASQAGQNFGKSRGIIDTKS